MTDWEREAAIWLQEHGQAWHWLLKPLSDLGPSPWLASLMLLLYWCVDHRRMVRVWIAFLAASWITDFLKVSLQHPRPCWIDPAIRELSPSKGFGMPSGHVLSATAAWGEMGRRRLLGSGWILPGAAILAVALSRVYLGAHTVLQTLAGLGAGALLLLGLSVLEPPVRRWLERSSTGAALLALLLLSLLMAGSSLALRLVAETGALDERWLAAEPFSPDSACFSAAGLLGFGGGYLILARLGGAAGAPGWPQRLRRLGAGAGLLSMGALAYHLWPPQETLADLPPWAGLPVRCLMVLLATGLASLGAPLLFRRLGW